MNLLSRVVPFYLDSLSGTDYDSTTAYSILFEVEQSKAGAYFEFPLETSALFSAYKDGNLLESFTFYNETCCSSPTFLGFAGIAFDEIRFGGIDGDDFYMDSLRYTYVVPISAAVWLFASGLGFLGWLRRARRSGFSRDQNLSAR